MNNNLSIFSPKIPKLLKGHIEWGSLYGSGIGLAISNAAKSHQGISFIITKDVLTSYKIESELCFFLKDKEFPILNFPDRETLAYDYFSPHQDIISERLRILSQVPTLKQGIIITSISTLMHKLCPRNYLVKNSLMLKVGQTLDLTHFQKELEDSGYICVSEVLEHGEFAVRGSIIDLYPMGSKNAYRIDLFDDEIDSIRIFDSETQRSIEKIKEIVLLPAHEIPLDKESISRFRKKFRDAFDVRGIKCSIYQDISDSNYSPGIEYYLPLFYENTESLFDYLPENSLIFRLDGVRDKAFNFLSEVKNRYEQLKDDISRPILSPESLFLSLDEVFSNIKKFSQIVVHEEPLEQNTGKLNFLTLPLPKLNVSQKSKEPLKLLQDFLKTNEKRVLFCAETLGRKESLLSLLDTVSINPKVVKSFQDFLNSKENLCITVAFLDLGLVCLDPNIVIITEPQLFEEHIFQRRRREELKRDSEAIIQNLTELNIGAPVVHIDHGIGRFLGLETITIDQKTDEYLVLEYTKGDKLYVPVSSLNLISRYSGSDIENAPLHHLGSDKWNRSKQKAFKKINDVAAELLNIYAKRSIKIRDPFKKPDEAYYSFVRNFPFEETPDQETAIEKVIEDMLSKKPMDRLVCGDVGFGKTEVAMRAAFLAIQNDKQVAMLVPTTLLANQHYQSFKDRFANFPIKIAILSRFCTVKEQHRILDELKNGKIDLIIGTHKLLQSSIKFSDLGLLMIDEEHRFGVRQKEKLKSLRAEVDILTLTATPIPRTLNMSFAGIRDLSIIATPPARRLSVKTFINEYDKHLIREAILREISRGGQVYYLHNKVKTIDGIASELIEAIPEARIRIAHGQMRKRELEKVMIDFYRRQFNVLVCTTIIESGIDIPSANTIIINRADTFGLADLHQLRGRVGRSHRQAYAYLIIPSKEFMNKDAKKRLEAVKESGDLGAGFMIATHDMEIRGAGELLGEEQSGHIQEIGFDLYMEMLERAVNSLKEGKEPDLNKPHERGIEVNLNICALIPKNYLSDIQMRLVLYKRISNAKSNKELEELKVEMIDRFGLLPIEVKNLFKITGIKIKAKPLGIKKIDVGLKSGKIEFEDKPNIDPDKIIDLVRSDPRRYKLAGSNCLKFVVDKEEQKERIKMIEKLIDDLF